MGCLGFWVAMFQDLGCLGFWVAMISQAGSRMVLREVLTMAGPSVFCVAVRALVEDQPLRFGLQGVYPKP